METLVVRVWVSSLHRGRTWEGKCRRLRWHRGRWEEEEEVETETRKSRNHVDALWLAELDPRVIDRTGAHICTCSSAYIRLNWKLPPPPPPPPHTHTHTHAHIHVVHISICTLIWGRVRWEKRSWTITSSSSSRGGRSLLPSERIEGGRRLDRCWEFRYWERWTYRWRVAVSPYSLYSRKFHFSPWPSWLLLLLRPRAHSHLTLYLFLFVSRFWSHVYVFSFFSLTDWSLMNRCYFPYTTVDDYIVFIIPSGRSVLIIMFVAFYKPWKSRL